MLMFVILMFIRFRLSIIVVVLIRGHTIASSKLRNPHLSDHPTGAASTYCTLHDDTCSKTKLKTKIVFESNFEKWLPKTKVIIIELHDRMRKGSSKAFFTALSNYNFSIAHRGENIIVFMN